jgi:hypothetical protein
VAVQLDEECAFERISAPVVRFGRSDKEPLWAIDSELIEASFSELKGAKLRSHALYLIKGDCTLPPDRLYCGSLIVTGCLVIGANTKVIGDIKARGGVVVGFKAHVVGSLTSEQRIQIEGEAVVHGPVISETDILIGAYSRVGKPEQPTTITAENIIAEVGSIAHGTVWARDLGVVWSV